MTERDDQLKMEHPNAVELCADHAKKRFSQPGYLSTCRHVNL